MAIEIAQELFKLTIYETGCVEIREKLLKRQGRWQPISVPISVFMLDHPTHGRVLVDTGYAPRGEQIVSNGVHRALNRLLALHIAVGQTAAEQIPTDSVDYIVLTHLHRDHIAGLHDFPQAKLIYFEEAYSAVRDLSPSRAKLADFMPSLLPDDFLDRSITKSAATCRPINYRYMPFTHGWDIFGDGSLLGIHLPGHAYGQMGLMVQTAAGPVFLCADACWHSSIYRQEESAHALTHLLQNDRRTYLRTIKRLQELHQCNPQIAIYPSHCTEIREKHRLFQRI